MEVGILKTSISKNRNFTTIFSKKTGANIKTKDTIITPKAFFIFAEQNITTMAVIQVARIQQPVVIPKNPRRFTGRFR